jgi:hypothetical protein
VGRMKLVKCKGMSEQLIIPSRQGRENQRYDESGKRLVSSNGFRALVILLTFSFCRLLAVLLFDR